MTTERTSEPLQEEHGTARPITPSPEQVVALLKEWPRDNKDAANWLSAQALMHTAADLLTRLSAERDRLEGERKVYDTALAEANKLFPMRLRGGEPDPLARALANLEIANARAERAESERDEWKASDSQARDALNELFGKLGAAQSELSALKARVAEVLGPFKAVYRINEPLSAGWPDDKPNSEFIPGAWPSWSDFRQASNLHATLTGEQK